IDIPGAAGVGGHALGGVRLLARKLDADDVVADLDPVAVAQPVRLADPPRVLVDESAVGRDVAQPVAAVLVADLAMLARDHAIGIGQDPVEVLVAADIEAALAADLEAHRPAVRQGGDVLDRQTQRHSTEAPAERPTAAGPG